MGSAVELLIGGIMPATQKSYGFSKYFGHKIRISDTHVHAHTLHAQAINMAVLIS